MSEQKTYPFDLKRALAGDAVCTANGESVKFLGYHPEAVDDGRGVFAIHDGDAWRWWSDGAFNYEYNKASGLDLRMTTDGGPTVQDELVAALKEAREALRTCYDVCEYPADGNTRQDAAIITIEAALAKAGAL